MKVTDKLQKELDLGLTIEVPSGLTYYRVAGGQWYRDAIHTKGEVIKISLHELPNSVIEDSLPLDKHQGVKVRYKTRQELDAIIKPGLIDDLPWGEPHEEGSGDSKLFLTTEPHPYKGTDILIKISTTEEGGDVAKKAISLDYLWNGGSVSGASRGSDDLCITHGKLWRSPHSEDYDTHIILTPQQFMEGCLPEDKDKEYSLGWAKKLHQEYWASRGEGKKPDAFVIEAKDSYIYLWTEANKRLKEAPGSLYRYNLIHANEYFEKHPGPDKFKEYCMDDVTEFMKSVGHYAGYYVGVDTFKETGWEKREGFTIDKLELTDVTDDAYIDGGVLYTAGGSALIANNLLDELHSYNLMSKEDFLKVHKPVLKFKKWEVTTEDKHIIVACPGHPGERFYKKSVDLFWRIGRDARKWGVSIEDLWSWVDSHKKELGF